MFINRHRLAHLLPPSHYFSLEQHELELERLFSPSWHLLATRAELASDGDRILPGDGDIPLKPLLDTLRAIGYAGHVSLELMNPQIWQIPPRQVGEVAMTALRRVLGLASMG